MAVLLQADPAPTDPPAVAPGAPVLVPDDPTRPPLLPEGAFLTRAEGTLDFDDATQSWIFRSTANSAGSTQSFDRVFGLLPSMALDDMINHVQESGARTSFEVTARVLVYNGRNFLLPSMATRISRPIVEPPVIPDPDPGIEQPDQPGQPEQDTPENSLDQEQDGVADRLEDRLRERINALPRSADVLGSSADGDPSRILHEGMRVQNRRGAIVRDQRSGTFRFVFDARGSSTNDPAMEILPCLMLARLELRVAESDLPPAVYISGEITSFRGRHYLLPTAWRPAPGSRNIVP